MSKHFIITEDGQISDGYHTFDELYEHRHHLLALTLFVHNSVAQKTGFLPCSFMTKKDKEGNEIDGWFIAGANTRELGQISYHVPDKYWDMFAKFTPILESNTGYDGHTSNDVLERIKNIIG